MVFSAYVEKKEAFAVEAAALKSELKNILGICTLQNVRIINCYYVQGISKNLFKQALSTVFSEPALDITHNSLPCADYTLGAEFLPGQFDQRANSAAECIQLISLKQRPKVCSAKAFLFFGKISPKDKAKIENYLINPVECQKSDLNAKKSLENKFSAPTEIEILNGFTHLNKKYFQKFIREYQLAMDAKDLAVFQQYYQKEKREPSLTELKIVDTYWSDHCRHTTFNTELSDIKIIDENALLSYNLYLKVRKELDFKKQLKPISLMNLATIAAKEQKRKGLLKQLDESDEINACSVKTVVDVDGKDEDWLLLFKNETHNHPTEIEPFGGAATCIGGAIRDPLANRGYVFGGVRISGAANPLQALDETLPGKLPQRKICSTAAAGFSSYGNQIGLATSLVKEIYHPGYAAKHMELGAVIGAVPQNAVRRECPKPGDVVILLGGKTGRDGCGGATGSSRAHSKNSLLSCGAQVQKGNAPEERKLQRFFKNPKVTQLIVRCNDFGAGGVSVAIGELADGLDINLDAVPKKYDGLCATELAISESQERMAVVVAKKDAAALLNFAKAENLSACIVAKLTKSPRLVMRWQGQIVANISREFLSSNGAKKQASVLVNHLPTPAVKLPQGKTFAQKMASLASNINVCSQKGLVQMFDSTIGAGTVLLPLGGKKQLSPSQALAIKMPTDGETTTCAGMAFGFDAFISQENPHTGAYLAVVDSLARLCAAGFCRSDVTLTFQEYFPRLGKDKTRWGQPFAALLGAFSAQMALDVAAIGGKDSMSGSFESLDVPPTLVSFAVASGKVQNIRCAEFQLPQSKVIWLRPKYCKDLLTPKADSFKDVLLKLESLIKQRKVLSVRAVGKGGLAEALLNMCLGNGLGFSFAKNMPLAQIFAPAFASFLVELEGGQEHFETLGETTLEYTIKTPKKQVLLAPIEEKYKAVLEPIYQSKPNFTPKSAKKVPQNKNVLPQKAPYILSHAPRALIPVFPGTNCEYDTAKALKKAGANPEIFVLQNLSQGQVKKSSQQLALRIAKSQMVVIPGGFSGGDEPEGSAKLISAFFRGEEVSNAVSELLLKRQGLMLGICNGFQALIKLGLLPYGNICPPTKNSPTLTFNTIGRHQSALVRTKICSNLSPWLCKEEVGAVHTLPISNGEGRFFADEAIVEKMMESGQICTQYVDFAKEPSMDVEHNPSQSTCAVEAICSPCGRILGKMAHSERFGNYTHINVPGNKHQKLFEGGVAYFSL